MKYLFSILIFSLVSCNSLKKPTGHQAFETGKLQKLISLLENPSDKYIMVAAHRGDWRYAPENSLPAMENCIKMGVDILEIDVRKTKDGHLVLMHDKTVDRTTTGIGKVENLTLDSLKKLRLKNGYGMPTQFNIPTLEEVMILAKGKVLVFIDKAYPIIQEAYAILEKTGTTNQGIFEGKEPAENVKKDYPILYKKIYYMPRLAEGETGKMQDYITGFMASMRPAGFVVSFSTEISKSISVAHQLKEQKQNVLASTMWAELCAGHTDDLALTNPDENWGWIIKQGANIICTDRPEELIEYLKVNKKH